MCNKDNGFTLVELMIAVAILAVLGVIGLSIYVPVANKTKCETVITTVHSVMELLVEDEAEDGVGPTVTSGFASSDTINGQPQTYPTNVVIDFRMSGADWQVDGRRSDITCTQGSFYRLDETSPSGAWQ